MTNRPRKRLKMDGKEAVEGPFLKYCYFKTIFTKSEQQKSGFGQSLQPDQTKLNQQKFLKQV